LGTFKNGLNDSDLVKSVFGPVIDLSVDTYANPKSALSDFKAGAYDLILLDIKMPEMNGFELYEELMKVDEKPKICFITAYETYYEVLKKDFPELDVGCFIKKPILISDLAKRVKDVLEH
jgi:DNA-binding LytR/AlgR family response regulator